MRSVKTGYMKQALAVAIMMACLMAIASGRLVLCRLNELGRV